MCSSDLPHWVPEGHVRVLAQLSFTGDPELAAMGVPSLAELATTPEQKDMLGLIFAPANFGRPFVAPPGLPTPVLGAWREAFRAAAHDAGLAADLEKARSVVRYDGPEVVQKLFATADALDAPTLQAYAGDLVGTTHVRQAVTLGMMGFQLSRTVGPPVAGVLVVAIGPASAFWVNAASFVVVAVTVAIVREIGRAHV